ncbi:LysR family transcriptional regulator [Streptomyces sp. 8L]|uniref:LysR family transcriptional regulator n=1 Tax=Streptomyces sp. 8L TaxID=2877242 RepID=UPI001CD3EE0A|nr:LysR family transcriptional regulator [Streptomyces sp. 8L]MCA1218425.1 LysR family transcriptional regulator [Streptomyces sp. 8L]
MDLVGACRVFVHVGERGSFTLGAAAAQVPQSVASRRIAALEQRFGERLFDRSTRRAALTAFGRDMLPAAKRLVRLADELEYSAERARLRPLTVAVPETCAVRHLALLDAASRERGTALDFRTAGPQERARLLADRDVRAALVAVVPDEATWCVPLGVASRRGDGAGSRPGGDARPLRIDTLRPARTAPAGPRLWLQPEDDVPHVRDRLTEVAQGVALAPSQVAVAASLTAALSDVLRTANLLVCSAAQARELGLDWRPLAGLTLARGYRAAAIGDETHRLDTHLWDETALCLGAPAGREDRRAPAGREDWRAPADREDWRAPAGREQRDAPAGREDRGATAGRNERRAPAGREERRCPPNA